MFSLQELKKISDRKIIDVKTKKEIKITSGVFKKYRKKPIVIEAYQTSREALIKTLEGNMKANVGDWIIKGINDELYPCKPDIFNKTYEKV